MRARAIVGLVAGLLLTAALPPFGWWPLALLGIGALATTLEGQEWPTRLTTGLATGAGLVLPGLWWMKDFSLPGYVIAALLEAAMVALVALASPPGRWRWIGLPAAMVLVEALRGRWPFGGVPIATFAQTQIGGPLAQTGRLGGPLLIAGLVGVAGAGIAAAMRRRRWVTPLAGVTVLLAVVAGTAAPDGHRTGALTAALVQGGGDRGTRAVDTDPRDVYEAHRRATKAAVARGAGLVLWPEDVVDVNEPVAGTPLGAALARIADDLDTTLVAGVVEDVGRTRFSNVAQAWGTSGQLGDRYTKNQRVPFGEYIPFRSLIERIADVSAVPRDATVGHGPAVLRTEAGNLGVSISYEVFFARRARAAVRAGGEILLVPTNASSYDATQMPALELGAARLRAIETGRWVLQAAPTGFSAAIDPRGRVRDVSQLGRREVITVTAGLRAGETPYTRLGDLPVVLLAALFLAAAWALDRWDPLDRRR